MNKQKCKSIMIQGVASNTGKSILTAGLCRIFKQDGYKVAPFKSQNMALNSSIIYDGHEIAIAQAMQAEAAGIKPDIRMNPVLLKPTGEKTSQVIVKGVSQGFMSSRDYFQYKDKLKGIIKESYDSLASENNIIVIEGAGSPAEINLKENDIVNMGMASMAEAPVLLAGDIDRGGVFASLAGTLMLLDNSEKEMVKGVIINKFRGDIKLLENGLAMLEDIIHKPVIGVVPHMDINLDDEDSLSAGMRPHENKICEITVVKFPRITNFNDFNPMRNNDIAAVNYATAAFDPEKTGLLIVPGTGNLHDDEIWMKRNGIEESIRKYAETGKPLMGIREGALILSRMKLLDKLNIVDEPSGKYGEKGYIPSSGGFLKNLEGMKFKYSGNTFEDGSTVASKGNCYGISVNGFFSKPEVVKEILEQLLKNKGIVKTVDIRDMESFNEHQYNMLAEGIRNSLNMDMVYSIIEKGL